MERTNGETNPVVEESTSNRTENISKLISKHFEFVDVSSNITTDRFLTAASQLCHMDTDLAEQVWLQMFPRLWDVLDDQQRNVCIIRNLSALRLLITLILNKRPHVKSFQKWYRNFTIRWTKVLKK